jgi:hypothetical protein
LLDAKANINNPSFTGVVTIPNIANLETAVTANTAKVGITSSQASAITANTAKVGITSSQASAITANTAKTGITSGQASEITANTAKTGITSGQASAITANTAKVSLDDNSVTLAKLAHGTAGKYLGFNDSTGNPEEKTITASGTNIVMGQDTTALNHTYSTTTTATTGETTSATVTNEAVSGGSWTFPNFTMTTFSMGSFGLQGNISGTLTFTFDVTGGSYSGNNNLANITIAIKNSSGTTVASINPPNTTSNPAATIKTISFTDIDAHTWSITAQGAGSNVNATIYSASWSGTRNEARNPAEMNSATNDGSGSSIYYASISATNPYVTTDFGSSTRIASVAIMPRTQNTETIFQIQTSNDGSTWVTNRTILASALTNWIYNYVKLTPVSARYVRIYGYSGASKVISFDEIKVKVGISDTSFLDGHYHKDISTTDTSLTLAGD